MLLDLSAAFDTVDHQSLLANRFSIDSMALRWCQSYLTDRTQIFTYKGGETSSFSVDCSVPQASVLGPHCFSSYTEDIAIYWSSTPYSLTCTPTTLSSTTVAVLTTSSCVDDISSWCKSRRLQVNANKTEAIWLGSRSNLAKIANSDCSVQVALLDLDLIWRR